MSAAPSTLAAGPAWLRATPFLLIALIVAAYAPTWDADFVVWDDDDHIYENRHIIAEDGYWEAFRDWRDPAFYPVTFTSWYVEWHLSEGDPWLFHVDNVVLHVVNAILLGMLLRALGLSYGLAWAIAGVWALHPQQVASVAWLTERKNLLYALFYLASMLVYARSVAGPDGGRTRGWVAALLLALAALLSKATAVTLPVAIVLTHWVCGGRFDRRAIVRIGAFFALSLVVGLVHVSREQVNPLLPFGTRMLIASRAAWFYVGKFLWPTELVAVYPRWDLAGAARWGGVSLAALGATALAGAWFARRIPPVAWLGVAMYAANIALVIGVIWFPFMGYSFVSDHLVYVAAVGLALVFGLVAHAGLDAAAVPNGTRVAASAVLWLVLAALTWQQTGTWENTEALWTRTLAANPTSRLAHKNLGAFYLETGRPDEARAQFEATLALHPGDLEALMNLGVLASDAGRWDEATHYYVRVLEAGAYPAVALNNLGIAAARSGRPEVAVTYYERALEEDPGDARTWMNLGAARADVGDGDGAIEAYRESLRLEPGSARAHYNLALTLNAVGRPSEAADEYQQARRLDPTDTDAAYNLGVARMELEQWDAAEREFRAVLELDPEHADAAHNLGAVLLAHRQLEEAERAFERAHDLAPSDAATAGILARLRSRRGDAEGAVRVLETALSADPGNASLTGRLAWIRATADAPVRDPDAAVELARRAVAASAGDPVHLDTLAAALAAAGRFDEAVTVGRAVLAATAPEAPMHAERSRRLDLYRDGRALR